MLGFSYADLRDLAQSGILGWPIVTAMWASIIYFANRAAIRRTRKERDSEQQNYNRMRDQRQAQIEDLERRREQLADQISSQFQRRIAILVAASRELRRLLTLAMARSDALERWVTVLEVVVRDHRPDIIQQKPNNFGRSVTAMDIAAVFAEHGDSDEIHDI